MTDDQIAINAISTADAPLEDLCAAYAAAGFRNVEFPLQRIKAYLARGKSVDDVRALLNTHNLRCIGGFETHVACFADAAKMRENHELILGNAKLIADLGGGVMVVGTDGPEQKSFVALDAVGRTMLSLIDKMP